MRAKLSWLGLLRIVSIVGVVTIVGVATIVGVLAGLLLPAWKRAGQFDLEHRYPALASRRIPRLTGIAGEYYLGDGLGMNLRLSILTDGRYSLVESGCTGLHHRESGFVQETRGHFVLSSSGSSRPSIKREFVLIG
jgi:hypothetical protein